jgi:hypothetical protein
MPLHAASSSLGTANPKNIITKAADASEKGKKMADLLIGGKAGKNWVSSGIEWV